MSDMYSALFCYYLTLLKYSNLQIGKEILLDLDYCVAEFLLNWGKVSITVELWAKGWLRQRMEGFLSILLSFAALDFEMQPVLCVCERRKGEDLVRIRMQMYHFP